MNVHGQANVDEQVAATSSDDSRGGWREQDSYLMTSYYVVQISPTVRTIMRIMSEVFTMAAGWKQRGNAVAALRASHLLSHDITSWTSK